MKNGDKRKEVLKIKSTGTQVNEEFWSCFPKYMRSHSVHIGGLRFPSATAVSSHETRRALLSGAAESEYKKNGKHFQKLNTYCMKLM